MKIRNNSFLILVIAAIGLLGAACAGIPDRSGNNPALPAGFGAVVPNADIQVYTYINQGEPFAFSPTDEELEIPPIEGYPTEAKVDSLAFWASFAGESPVIGIRADFVDERLVPLIKDMLESDGTHEDAWFLEQGDVLYTVLGSGDVAASYQQVITDGDFVTLEELSSEAWNSILALPENPPMPPVAVGYIDIAEAAMNQIVGKVEENFGDNSSALERLKPLIERAGVRNGVFAFYGEELPSIAGGVGLNDVDGLSFSGLVILDSSVPSFILSFIFDVVLSGAGLEEIDLDGTSAYMPPIDDFAVLLAHEGSTILISVASDQAKAEGLLNTANAQ